MAQQAVTKSVDQPEETRTFPKGKIELIKLGGVTVGKATFQPGWRWSECVKPIAGTDSCQAAHVTYMLAGRVRTRMDNGSEIESGPGEVIVVPPGHDAWVVGDQPVIALDFSGMADFAETR